MGQINDRLRSVEGAHFQFWCPGCKDTHTVAKRIWSFDGNYDAPTVSPSIITRCGHYCDGHKHGDPCWCTWNAENPDKAVSFACYRCHIFVKGGMIEFLSDCSHELAGHTAPIPALPDHLRDDRGVTAPPPKPTDIPAPPAPIVAPSSAVYYRRPRARG